MNERQFLLDGSEELATIDNLKSQLRDLRLVPDHLRDLTIFAPALVVKNQDGNLTVALGCEEDAIELLPHEAVANRVGLDEFRCAPAYHVEVEDHQTLCVDPDRLYRIELDKIEDLEAPMSIFGYQEVFVGGFKDAVSDSEVSLVGISRQVATILRIAELQRLSFEQTQVAIAFMINSLQIGMPIHLQDAIRMATN